MQLHPHLTSGQHKAHTLTHYDDGEEQQRLLEVLQGAYLAMLKAVNALTAVAFATGEQDPADFVVDDTTTRQLLQYAASRVVRIDATTREAIAATLQQGQQRGYTNWQLAHGVPDDNYPGIDGLFKETWKSRPDVVARTEMQAAQLASAIARYHATGMVDQLEIIDGCQWDQECCERNGTIVPITNPPTLNHPNCTLVVLPVLRRKPAPLQAQGEAAVQPALL